LARRTHTTPFAAFLALVDTLLARLSGQDELIVGVPFGGRAHPASEGLVGFFVNTLPIRAQLASDRPVSSLIEEIGQKLAGAQQHQAYPFDRLVETLGLPRDTARSPVFDVLVSVDEGDAALPDLHGVR